MLKCSHTERLIAAWNERQARRMPLLFTPKIGASACRTMRDIDLRTLDRHRDAAITSLIPSLSCRSCQSRAPFAELVRLSKTSVADEMRIERTHRVLGDSISSVAGKSRSCVPGCDGSRPKPVAYPALTQGQLAA